MFQGLLPTKPGTEPLKQALVDCRWHFGIAALFSAFVNLLYLAPTLYMLQVYDRVVPTGGMVTLGLVTAVAVLALACLTALDALRTRLLVRAGLRLDKTLAATVLSRVISTQSLGPRGTQALREFDNVRGAMSGAGVLAVFDAPWTPVYVFFAFLLHPLLGLLTLVSAIILLVLALLNERDTRPRLQQAILANNRAYAAQEAIASQGEIVRALGMRRDLTARQVEERQQAIHANATAQFVGGRYGSIIKFIRLVVQSLALGLGALLAVKGWISSGSIIASSVLLSRAVAPIESLVGAWPGLIQARTSWKSLTDLFAETAGHDRERTALPTPQGHLSVEGVSVRLKEGDDPQLKNVSFKLAPGQVMGVIGASGSGKTTLSRVVAGAMKPGLGTVRIDGSDYDAWDGDRLGRFIGYLPQAPTLFAGSIKENITRFAPADPENPEVQDAAAVAAGKAAGVHELIQKLPMGYDTVLGPGGMGLSAGQTQRVALARALYLDPPLLVLDEPNASLDQDGEQALMRAMQQAAQRGAAIFIVAHRTGALALATQLMVMRAGAIEMIGPRDEILAKLQPQPPAQTQGQSRPQPKPANVQ